MNSIPNMMEYILRQQGRDQPSEDEMALLAASQDQQPMMVAQGGQGDDAGKASLLQRLFGRQPLPPMPVQQPGARPVDELLSPGSMGDQLRQRRLEQERMMKEQAGLQPEDMMVAQNDGYGGVSAQTRAAMDQMARQDPTGEFGDAMIGRPTQPAAAGGSSGQSVRGKQSVKQEDQLIKMLIDRGMSPAEARQRARSII